MAKKTIQCQLFLLCETSKPRSSHFKDGFEAGLEKPGFKKKPAQFFGFFVFFCFFYIFAQKREFLGFFLVSRILLGASRL